MRARKRFGQHFLEPAWADRLVAAIEPRTEDRFLEIGPGTGALTHRLAPHVRHVTAVELDRDLVAALAPRVPANVTLISGDFLEYDLGLLIADGPVRVAGNLPYNVSSPILFRLIAAHRDEGGLRDATLMLQHEVADRIQATPGSRDYGVLAILVQLHADVHRLLSLPPGAFRPAPRVHSAVVRLRFRSPAVVLRDEAVFEAMVRSMFTQRRKTLLNALRPFAEALGTDPTVALASAHVDPRRRGETLQLTELARLADFFAAVHQRAVL
ncbi:MAG: 16S rRNA (adenine(1518)-N(6)/adenine(1519)-N(6))-dimethyltransferase RsmA [Acidobacteria bacterium]|nr:16S rRNA (adenine(1518)-N(6)/adenine(1519)-N(6))-dimethyltransferase RsmA [Acidobacteriota bacterium]MCA1649913.1 16S rRNA (adenine(1518)-N(6)/adenine(1519)-N(6))-dimethyltransferase RsmA [Acidobacteriota bacterium]